MIEKIERIRLCLCTMGEETLPYIHISVTNKEGVVDPVPMSTGVSDEGFDIVVVEEKKRLGIKFIEGFAFIKSNKLWIYINGKEAKTDIDEELVNELLDR